MTQTTVSYTRKGNSVVRGKDRSGIKAKDYVVQTTDSMAKEFQPSPLVEKPRVLVETMRVIGTEGTDTEISRVIGADLLTAQDNAVYEYLLVNAKKNGMTEQTHEIDTSVILKFLEIEHVDRIHKSLDRLARTHVQYDFQDEHVQRKSTVPLIYFETVKYLKSGTTLLTYELPGAVQRRFLDNKDYALLEINSFPRFRCKYSAWLYQRLALRAGYDKAEWRVWEIEPVKLAEQLGYSDKDGFLYASFYRRCLKPVLADIEEFVHRFKVEMSEVRGTGRGRPVEMIRFVMSERMLLLEETKADDVSPYAITLLRNEKVHTIDEVPGSLVVGRAAAKTGIADFKLVEGWFAALDRAKANSRADIGGLEGWIVLGKLKDEGVGQAFAMWAQAQTDADIDTTRKATPVRAIAVDPEVNDELDADPPNPVSPERMEKNIGYAVDEAERMLHQLEGYQPLPVGRVKMKFENSHFITYCDPGLSMWLYPIEAGLIPEYAPVRKALRVLLRTSNAHRRESLGHLGRAIKERDWKRVASVLYAVEKAGIKEEMETPPPVMTRSFYKPTKQITEADAGETHDMMLFDCGISLIDSAADVNPTDDCPF